MRPPLFRRMDRYVLLTAGLGVGAAAAVIAVLIVLIDFVALSRDVGVRARDTSIGELFGLTLLQSPGVVLSLAPFAFLFGVLAAFVQLNRRSELVALRAAGVSAWRFIAPAALGAAATGVVTALALNPAASALNSEFELRKAAVMEGYLVEAPKAVWLREGDRRGQYIIRAARRLPGAGVRLADASFFVYALDDRGGLRFTRRIDAAHAELAPGAWRLTGALEGAPGADAVRYDTLAIPSVLRPEAAQSTEQNAQAVPFWSLPGLIRATERAGFSATGYRLRFQQLLATPLMYAAMSVLAAAFSLRLLRLGGLARLAGAATALGFLFFFVSQLCQALGRSEVIPPALAAWAPPLLALLCGVTLLLYTEDG